MPTHNFVVARETMVREQIIARGVIDGPVLAAMRRIQRHRFVPSHLVGEAYADHPLPIGHGQTISQPYIVAFMTEMLRLAADDTVLEIGTGCGYQTAVLAAIADRVCSLEIVPTLAKQADALLHELGIDNVEIRCGNGRLGWPCREDTGASAPASSPPTRGYQFDAIIVTAAPAEVPPRLLAQLAPGGRMVIPVGDWSQELIRITRGRDGALTREHLLPVRFVPMTGE